MPCEEKMARDIRDKASAVAREVFRLHKARHRLATALEEYQVSFRAEIDKAESRMMVEFKKKQDKKKHKAKKTKK